MRILSIVFVFSIFLYSSFTVASLPADSCPFVAKNVKVKKEGKEWVIRGAKNFLTDYAAQNSDGSVNVVVEIPAGCNDKWEVTSKGYMIWDKKKGKFRFVKYLAYPGNYGMIPGTLSGDGDPLDVIVLGPAAARASIQKVRVIAILTALDDGEIDDKLIAVSVDKSRANPFAKVKTINDLPSESLSIVKTWFANYKPGGTMKITGVLGSKKANSILAKAVKSYKSK